MPFMPSFLVNWHHKQFAISGGFFIIGGGGEAKFNDGLPMVDQFISGTIQAQATQNEQLSQLMKASGVTASDLYDAKFTGKQYVFAWQLGASYRFHEMFYAFLGMRINYAYNSYEGSMKSRVDNEILN